MHISAKHMAILREHIRAESVHDMDALIGGMTSDCFNDVVARRNRLLGRSRQRNATASIGRAFQTSRCECAASYAPTNRALSQRMSGAALISGLSWDGRQLESQCECARSWSGTSRAMPCGARRSFSIMPPCSSRLVLRSKSRQPRERWSRQRSRLSTHRFSATARHSNKFASRMLLSAHLSRCHAL